MDFNIFTLTGKFTDLLLGIGRFFQAFTSYRIEVGDWVFTPFELFGVGAGAFILAIIVRAIIRAVAV